MVFIKKLKRKIIKYPTDPQFKKKTESNSVKGNEKSKLFTFFFFFGIILLVYLLGAEKSKAECNDCSKPMYIMSVEIKVFQNLI